MDERAIVMRQRYSLDVTGHDFPLPARVWVTWKTDERQLIFEPDPMPGNNPINRIGQQVVQFNKNSNVMHGQKQEIQRVLRLMRDEVKSSWQARGLII